MLNGIWELLKSFGNLIVSLVQLIIDAITGVLSLLGMIPQYVNYAASVISMMPAWFSVFCIGILTISVLWAIRRAL